VFNRALADARVLACPDCDLLQTLPSLEDGSIARCPRCDHQLWRRRRDSLDRTLALALAAAILYVIANLVPMLGVRAVGHASATTVFGGVRILWDDGREVVAALVFLTVIVAPALQIGAAIAVSLGVRRRPTPSWVVSLMRLHPMATTWSMIEVMMVGVLVALTKIAELATVVPGLSLFVLGALVFLIAAVESSLDPREVWENVDWVDDRDDDGISVPAGVGSMP
jgi:paraquat-inducible protein A